MSTRLAITLVLSLIVSSVLFGIGAVAVLSIESWSQNAALLLPLVVAVSIALAPVVAWKLAPMLRAQYSRRIQLQQAFAAKRATHQT